MVDCSCKWSNCCFRSFSGFSNEPNIVAKRIRILFSKILSINPLDRWYRTQIDTTMNKILFYFSSPVDNIQIGLCLFPGRWHQIQELDKWEIFRSIYILCDILNSVTKVRPVKTIEIHLDLQEVKLQTSTWRGP